VPDAGPRTCRNVEEPVDPSQVDEKAIFRDVLDRALHDRADLEVLKGLFPHGARSELQDGLRERRCWNAACCT